MDGAKGVWKLKTRRVRRYLPIACALIALIIAVSAGAWWFMPGEVASAKASIAVLPFDNIGTDEMSGRFAEGVTEDIITDLSRYREVDVIARNSTAVYKGKPADIRQVGRYLNVHYVLEGSVQHQADKIRVTAQLLDARTAAHVWSDRWDRPVADLFTLQAEISEQVVSRLLESGGASTTAEHVANRRKDPRNMSAYELYLQGREEIHRLTKESVARALSLLLQAVEKDPSLARGWVELAAAHDLFIEFGADPGRARGRALEAAKRAVDADPMDAMAHVQLAVNMGMMGDMKRTEAEFDTALRLNPSSADIMAYMPVG